MDFDTTADKQPPNKESARPGSSANSGSGEGFECNICFDPVTLPVLSLCGHLYCWPCIYRWLQRLGKSATCPVCKAGISTEQVIPVYARGQGSSQDPRKTVPAPDPGDVPDRPSQRRPPARGPSAYDYWRQLFRDEGGVPAGDGGLRVHFGIGFLPWLGLVFPPDPTPAADHNGAPTQQQQQQIFLSRVFLLFGLFVILSAIFQL